MSLVADKTYVVGPDGELVFLTAEEFESRKRVGRAAMSEDVACRTCAHCFGSFSVDQKPRVLCLMSPLKLATPAPTCRDYIKED